MHDRKDPLDWDLNGSNQSGGDFPRLNFNRQHSQGAPQQQAPPPPPPQFNRQLSNDIFGHVPNGKYGCKRFLPEHDFLFEIGFFLSGNQVFR